MPPLTVIGPPSHIIIAVPYNAPPLHIIIAISYNGLPDHFWTPLLIMIHCIVIKWTLLTISGPPLHIITAMSYNGPLDCYIGPPYYYHCSVI